MSNRFGTYVPAKFDLTEVQKRVNEAKADINPFTTLVEDNTKFIAAYDEHVCKGYRRSPEHPLLILGNIIQLVMLKPKKMLEKEYEQLSIEVEADYKAEIKAEQADALDKMKNRIIIEAQEARAKETAQEQEILEAAALAEAMQILNLEAEAEVVQ